MADIRVVNNAQEVADVWTITPANVAATNTFTVTINGKAITYTAIATTVAEVTAGLVALLNASGIPGEFTEALFTDGTTKINAVGTPGVPVTITSSASGGTATLVTVHVTTATGPNFADNTANYSGGSLPTNADRLFFGSYSSPLLYALEALAAVTLAYLEIDRSFQRNARIGLDAINPKGYVEYRPRYFKVGATTWKYGTGFGNGPTLCNLDFSTIQYAGQVLNGGGQPGSEVLRIKGTHASNTLSSEAGATAVAYENGTASKVALLTMNGGSVRGSSLVQWTDIEGDAGSVDIAPISAMNDINSQGMKITIGGEANIATITCEKGGVVNYNVSGTVNAVIASSGGRIDCSGDSRDATFLETTLNAGGVIHDPAERVSKTIEPGVGLSTITGA